MTQVSDVAPGPLVEDTIQASSSNSPSNGSQHTESGISGAISRALQLLEYGVHSKRQHEEF
jgi:hypothetical protein